MAALARVLVGGLEAAGSGRGRSVLARELLRVVLRQIFVDGVYHADSHPGNVLVRPDGTLALIDFGSVGRFDALQQAALARALLAVSRRDPRQPRDALVDLTGPRGVDEDVLEAALGQFLVEGRPPT